MIQAKILDDIVKQVTNALPAGIKTAQQDVEKNLRATLTGAFDRMGLVTREEFDVQSEVLARTRSKLETLVSRIAELEAKLLDYH